MRTRRDPGTPAFLVTCEHGGNRVPAAWRELFTGHEALLASHRGWDPGALSIARALARRLDAPAIVSTTTRLLVDLNRSPGNPRVFSELTRPLAIATRRTLLARHHAPHHARVVATIEGLLERHERVVHLGVHSFTPVLEGRVRAIDVALLYDPARPLERRFADRWLAALAALRPDLRLRRNAPYAGVADGLTTLLRRRFPARRYLGIELEVSQRLAPEDRAVRRALVESIGAVAASAERSATR
ncbi:MAG TPA: N-formylglutamate amidohydrolase [Phycisphaerales bacterium]|nr:N-formylglutamate amidohydrolase [Phycisphaerales bacterium]HMP38448.1 N-formylglutamate amidohydrolase [Phycisphaerales bacterium]